MYGKWKFRFLAHSLTTFGHRLAASGNNTRALPSIPFLICDDRAV
ncbi:replication protein [Escherichia coli]|nr:replication protein [Escherichia coli]